MPTRRSSDLTPAQRGYAPLRDHLGTALDDIRDPVAQGTLVPVVTFVAYDRASLAVVILDDRTFDSALHARTLEVYDKATGEAIVLKGGVPFDPALHSLDPLEVPNV